MVERGVAPDNVTFLTIIGCSRLRSLPGKAVEWFEKMAAFGVEPDDVTYAVMIDCYGRVGNVDMALRLYDRSRTEKWRLDAVTFTMIIKIYWTHYVKNGLRPHFSQNRSATHLNICMAKGHL
ncbi:putative tetratricopeptide-like helical domain superfamily [Helianthus annuus]|nr:putative tetratricopeptide-like helical domain superfamily [Helianthus annuus]